MHAPGVGGQRGEPVGRRRTQGERFLREEMLDARIELRQELGVVRIPLRSDDAVELLRLEQLAMVAVEAANPVPRRDELGRSLPGLGQRDELTLVDE